MEMIPGENWRETYCVSNEFKEAKQPSQGLKALTGTRVERPGIERASFRDARKVFIDFTNLLVRVSDTVKDDVEVTVQHRIHWKMNVSAILLTVPQIHRIGWCLDVQHRLECRNNTRNDLFDQNSDRCIVIIVQRFIRSSSKKRGVIENDTNGRVIGYRSSVVVFFLRECIQQR